MGEYKQTLTCSVEAIFMYMKRNCACGNMPAPLSQNRNSSSVEEIKPLFKVLHLIAVLRYRSSRRSINVPGKITKSFIHRIPLIVAGKAIQNNENHRQLDTNGKKKNKRKQYAPFYIIPN